MGQGNRISFVPSAIGNPCGPHARSYALLPLSLYLNPTLWSSKRSLIIVIVASSSGSLMFFAGAASDRYSATNPCAAILFSEHYDDKRYKTPFRPKTAVFPWG
jgi:hypothetical protein